MMEHSSFIFNNQNIMFLLPVIPSETFFSKLFQDGWTFQNDGTFISKCSLIPRNMFANRREHCIFVQKVQPKVIKVEPFKGTFLKNHICNICLLCPHCRGVGGGLNNLGKEKVIWADLSLFWPLKNLEFWSHNLSISEQFKHKYTLTHEIQ